MHVALHSYMHSLWRWQIACEKPKTASTSLLVLPALPNFCAQEWLSLAGRGCLSSDGAHAITLWTLT